MLSLLFSRRGVRVRPLLLPVLACLLLNALLSTCGCPPSRAAGVVNVPTEAALNAAMQGGGLVTFACDGVIPLTTTKAITTDTTLDATGHQITLDGGGSVQLFSAVAPAGSPFFVILKHITFANGYKQATAADFHAGGAFFVNNVGLTATDCVFANNTATSDPYTHGCLGGAICSDVADVINEITLAHCIFTNNRASATGDCAGGAIYVRVANLHISDCIFTNNTATAAGNHCYGGAIANIGESNTITNTTFSGNIAQFLGEPPSGSRCENSNRLSAISGSHEATVASLRLLWLDKRGR